MLFRFFRNASKVATTDAWAPIVSSSDWITLK
jgi:hypothetical protein